MKTYRHIDISSVQSHSHVWLFATPWTATQQASLSVTNSQSLLKLISIKLVMPFNNLILCHPLFLLQFFSASGFFSKESVLCIRWSKYWSFNFSISPWNEYSWLISFGIDWFDLHPIQGTLKSLLQHHSSKASILWHSAFFMVQFSHLPIPLFTIIVPWRGNFFPVCGRSLGSPASPRWPNSGVRQASQQRKRTSHYVGGRIMWSRSFTLFWLSESREGALFTLILSCPLPSLPFKHIRHVPASGRLHWLFLAPYACKTPSTP